MLLKEFIEGVQKFVEAHPEALELQVITSTDDEGNDYNSVYYSPTLGVYDDEFIQLEDTEEAPNVVCIN